MKLYTVEYLNDCDYETILMVGNSAKEVYAEFEKTISENLSCYMWHTVKEVVNVCGYTIKLHKQGRRFDGIEFGEVYPTREMIEQARIDGEERVKKLCEEIKQIRESKLDD